jgi:hypothetical protein
MELSSEVKSMDAGPPSHLVPERVARTSSAVWFIQVRRLAQHRAHCEAARRAIHCLPLLSRLLPILVASVCSCPSTSFFPNPTYTTSPQTSTHINKHGAVKSHAGSCPGHGRHGRRSCAGMLTFPTCLIRPLVASVAPDSKAVSLVYWYLFTGAYTRLHMMIP